MAKRLERIETHGHYMPAAIYGAAGEYGPEKVVDERLGQRTWRAGKWQSEPSTFRRGAFARAHQPASETAEADRGAADQLEKPTVFENSDPSERLGLMDKLNIDVMAISASPMVYCYGASVEDGIRYERV
jgi:hypothetical protein